MRGNKSTAFLVIGILLCAAFSAGAAEGPARSVGAGQGVLIEDGTRDLPCGYGNFSINSDQDYENGYAWDGLATPPPDWGAFAECFTAPDDFELCGLIFDLTTVYPNLHLYTLDAIVWEDDQGIPGNVLALVTGFDPYPVATWPSISRHTVPLVAPVTAPVWAGYWANFTPDYPPQWFVAAEVEGATSGCPYTKIAPGVGYPTGWHDVSVVWGPTHALGIGYYGHQPTSDVALRDAVQKLGSWGSVKALYH